MLQWWADYLDANREIGVVRLILESNTKIFFYHEFAR